MITRLDKIISRHFVVLATILMCAVSCLNGCSFGQDSSAHFKTLPDEGWNKAMSIEFTPEYSDSSSTYDIALAVRHNNDYQYSNLSLVVDLIDSVKNVNRTNIDFELSDGYGNWKGSGFGAIYQSSVVIAQGISPSQVSSIVVWQAMNNCDVVKNILDIGIIVTPSK
ncbi:MAG: gliding motility lipoprotein GldH [Muribaculaceae bacterium]|nr:gliding motility lipoprotein GldH [Muribaculaceae bacterium]